MLEEELQKRLIVKNFGQWKEKLATTNLSKEKLSVRTLENGIVLPAKFISGKEDLLLYEGGIVTPDMKFFAGYERVNPKFKPAWCELKAPYTVDKSEIVQSDESVIYCGTLFGHFGHLLVEVSNRMWYVLQHPERKEKLIFIFIGTWKINSWVYDFFELMDIPRDRIMIVEKPTQFKSITIPDQSARIKFDYHSEYLVPYDHIKNKISTMKFKNQPKKIFLARTSGKNTGVTIYNEKYFEKFFESRGYTVVEPEKLSIAEQVSLIYNADEIATLLGTLSHWALFCRENTKFVMLARCNLEAIPIQCIVNKVSKADWYIVDVTKDFLYDLHGGGVHLLGNTPYWQKYIKDHHGVETADDDEIDSSLIGNYIESYVNYHKKPQYKSNNIRSFQDLYDRVQILETRLKINRPVLYCVVHISVQGTLPMAIEGTIAGDVDTKRPIEAFKLDFSEKFHSIFYAVGYEDGTWTNEVKSPIFAGVTGKRKSICGIKIRLDDQGSKKFDIRYRIHDFDGAWSDWFKNGAEVRLEKPVVNAIQVELVEKIPETAVEIIPEIVAEKIPKSTIEIISETAVEKVHETSNEKKINFNDYSVLPFEKVFPQS